MIATACIYLFAFSAMTAQSADQDQRILTVDYGRDAVLNFSLTTAGTVAQVTLQKNSDPPEILATYSRRYGEIKHGPRLNWTASTSLSDLAVTIKSVTWTDEACYACIFNVYPSGSKRHEICLSIQGISNVWTNVGQTNPGQLVVSCSATGKPAPYVRWDVPGIDNASLTSSHRADENVDTTLNVSSNLTLVLPVPANYVECLVYGGSTVPMRERISLPVKYGGGDMEVEKESGISAGAIAAIVVGCLGVLIVVTIVLLVHKERTAGLL